jgi:hypothetical protein
MSAARHHQHLIPSFMSHLIPAAAILPGMILGETARASLGSA